MTAHDRILAAAAVCFERQGYQQTTMGDVCREAGVAAATLYRHFKSKESLFAAVGRPDLKGPDEPPYRRLILDAALDLFSRRGYQAATLTDIAAAAGVARTTLYTNFPTKESILMAIMAGNEAVQWAAAAGDRPGADPLAELEQLARRIAELERDPRRLALVRLLVAEGVRFPGLQEVYHRGETAVFAHLTEFFRSRWPGLTDPLFVARLFVGALLSLVRQEIVPGSTLPTYTTDEIARRVAAIVAAGIKGGAEACR